jgi:uncharacterized lipoprotein YbaY
VRKIYGSVRLPQNISRDKSRQVLIEVRDTSFADAPSEVVAQQRLQNVPLAPGTEIPFELEVPDVEKPRQLGLRVHVDLDGTGIVSPGDLLNVQAYPVAQSGDAGPVSVKVVPV